MGSVGPQWVQLENDICAPYSADALIWSMSHKRSLVQNPSLGTTMQVWDSVRYSAKLMSPWAPVTPLLQNPDFVPGQNVALFQWWSSSNILRIYDCYTIRGPLTIANLQSQRDLPPSEIFRALQVLHYISSLKNHWERSQHSCHQIGSMYHIWWTCPRVVRFWIRIHTIIFSVFNINLLSI
ncbi:hypothetical protein XELAEV_18027062mg [Xenopus laevis]|uniref:Uncharacterized protein n=1 Tax=Xenopus laevis TaxID=8355 RepID=A0A974CWY2_XENLA|nr:hypothetical protein XELAEV_18027062mg [Xenopus laevis]